MRLFHMLLYFHIASLFLLPPLQGFIIERRWVTRSKGILCSERTSSTSSNPRQLLITLISGFESFNVGLYEACGRELSATMDRLGSDSGVKIDVFSDRDLSLRRDDVENSLQRADAIICSLIFDFEEVMFLKPLLDNVSGPRLVFECATELMAFNRLGSFEITKSEGNNGSNGPPPAVKAILSKFGSGREEDKLAGYLKLLKVGPELLRLIPGEKASDLRSWLEIYRYWNQGGTHNVVSMLRLLSERYLLSSVSKDSPLPELKETPAVALIHPLADHYFSSPSEYVKWRESPECKDEAKKVGFKLAPSGSPRVAVLLYRKHVITNQPYILQLVEQIERNGLQPIPVFINGVEAHTIVREWLTSSSKYLSNKNPDAVHVDAIVNTIGFPLVGGPAGSMEAGRNVPVAKKLLSEINVPYIVAAPLLLQDIPSWRRDGVRGLQSVVLYSLPELDGAIDAVVLGGLVRDKIALIPERVRRLSSRIHGWVELARKKPSEKKIAILVYGYPPNQGAVGTAALLNVPRSLDSILIRLQNEGFDLGPAFNNITEGIGETIVAALALMQKPEVIATGADSMRAVVASAVDRAGRGDPTVASFLGTPWAAKNLASLVDAVDILPESLQLSMGARMAGRIDKAWGGLSTPSRNLYTPGVSSTSKLVVSGLKLGHVFIGVQPLIGIDGDPMRLLFQRDLTPHAQYCAFYNYLTHSDEFNADALIHLGTHGTAEWLPGLQLGNDARSWSDRILGGKPNLYIYAANNPSESILAKRRGYATIVSHNVPPYKQAGLYKELAVLKELVDSYRIENGDAAVDNLRVPIVGAATRIGILGDVPFQLNNDNNPGNNPNVDVADALLDTPRDSFDEWVERLRVYLQVLETRLFSSGLRVFGSSPKQSELSAYLNAFFSGGIDERDRVSQSARDAIVASSAASLAALSGHTDGFSSFEVEAVAQAQAAAEQPNIFESFFDSLFGRTKKQISAEVVAASEQITSAIEIRALLSRSTEELDGLMTGLSGGYVLPGPGGDLLRDGAGVLPTGRNIHSLDPYRMPSESAWARGQAVSSEIISRHQRENSGQYPETVAVALWGLDAIKTKGESVAIVVALVGGTPVKEGTGRIVRFDLVPLETLGRPRIDVLASMSGIFRDTFGNVVELLDDLFARAARAGGEPPSQNFIKKHSCEMVKSGVEERDSTARLFSNPPGDYGSLVNDQVSSSEWDNSEQLGNTWASRNAFSFRREVSGDSVSGKALPQVLDSLLASTDRIVQEIDSVEYGLTDIQEYYANTGALRLAAESRRDSNAVSSINKKRLAVDVVEAYGTSSTPVVRDLEATLRLEYRTKLLNPKWAAEMMAQGGGGVFEISQRLTAVVGWGACAEVDQFVFEGCAETYALDSNMANELRRANPEAFKNVIRRLLEASGRGMWDADKETIAVLKEKYAEVDDQLEGVSSNVAMKV